MADVAEQAGTWLGNIVAWPLILLFRVLAGFTGAIGSAIKSYCYEGKAMPAPLDRAAEACYEGSKIVMSFVIFFLVVIIVCAIIGCAANLHRDPTTKPKHD